MLGFSALGLNTPSIIDCYNAVQEKKNDVIATVVANHSDSKERIGATAIGATFGLAQSIMFAGAYGLIKKFPALEKVPFAKWAVRQVDRWIDIAVKNNPEKSFKYNKFVGIASKSIYLIGAGALLGFFGDSYKTFTNTRTNGKISNTKKGAVENSWLLSGLNSLSSTDEGKKVIKDSIKLNDDNSLTVKFKGVNKEYNITKKELKDASHSYITEMKENGKVAGYRRKYSKGDGDTLAFELAYEKYVQDVKEGKVDFDSDTPDYVKRVSSDDVDMFNAGSAEQFYYLMTGKKPVGIDMDKLNSGQNEDKISDMYSKVCLNRFFDNYAKKNNDYAVELTLKGDNDNKLALRNKYYALQRINTDNNYSIKKIDEKYVTIVNSANSKEKIILPINTLKANLASITYTDLGKRKSK